MDIMSVRMLWQGTLVLALATMAVFASLILLRSLRSAGSALRKRRQEQLRKTLLIHLETPLSKIDETFALRASDLEFLAEITQGILRAFSGDMPMKLLSFFEKLEIEPWLRRRATVGAVRSRGAAIQLLGFLPPDRARLETLVFILEQRNPPLIDYLACESLSRFSRSEDFTRVLDVLERIEDLSAPKIAAIFSRFSNSAEVHFQAFAMSHRRGMHIRLAAIEALAASRGHGGLSVLEALCWSDEDAVAAAAFAALARSGHSPGPQVIEHGARHPFWLVREQAAGCAEYSKVMPAEALQNLLGDPHWLVCIRAAQSLQSFGAVGQRIVATLASGSDRAARRAAQFLAEGGQEEAGALAVREIGANV